MQKTTNTRKKKSGCFKKYTGFMLCVLAAVVAMLLLKLITRSDVDKVGGTVGNLYNLSGYARTASAEEVAFFQEQVARSQGSLTAETLQGQTKQYINAVNAVYLLGSQLGICEPFDFAQLQQQHEAENADRQKKKQMGEVYYGPDSLSLTSFFQYQYNRIQADILTYLLDHRDEAMVQQARQFYEQNPKNFTRITQVRYEITQAGETTEYTLESDAFRSMGQSDPLLMDFLAQARDGEEICLGDGADQRTVKKLGTMTELLDFDENERLATEMYLLEDVMDALLAQIAQKNEVVF